MRHQQPQYVQTRVNVFAHQRQRRSVCGEQIDQLLPLVITLSRLDMLFAFHALILYHVFLYEHSLSVLNIQFLCSFCPYTDFLETNEVLELTVAALL
jgi:hypothetical protein